MINPSAQAFLEQSIDQVGVMVTISRLVGFAPNVTTVSATIKAKVDRVAPNTTAPARDGLSASAEGSVSQDDRTVLLMDKALCASGFPVPIIKGDKVALPQKADVFDVTLVDPYTRAIAGGVTLTVTGV